METTSIKLYSLNYNDTKTYLATLLFVVGNMALPQLFHLIPQGGITWLPIYFFVVGLYQADCLLSHLFINQTTYKQIASEYLQSHARQTDTEILYGTEKIVDKDPFA